MGLELTVDNLVKRFGTRELFAIEQLQVREGESVHLKGENGVGKTTLMKIMAGLEKPCSGTVIVTPKQRRWWSGRIHPDVIYLHQTPYVFMSKVIDNVAYGLKLRGGSRQNIKIKVKQALVWARLEHLAEQPAHSLSGGERQRLALARAWILAPRLLFLDEPTANLDRHSVSTVAELVSQLLKQGTTIMVSSHQSNRVTELCTRHLLLEGGALHEGVHHENMPHEIDSMMEPQRYAQH
ncbi:energy-coupling factor ABC transporter ATP-binding protein [Neptunomonas antarctica]|uniref:Tungstate transport system ATP-binding protein n=1 Tax=Neptunomonas antarctica TaxID=619304 RepID=A0A1N7ND48_9GAMM|nr:ABC transporter ATP-binding protein [Neptunomonas antarctica]SIS96274.1 tungstate transport system ATP-binding protein [Neptunomonas antarctica]